jgi:hypothetical protein
LRGNDHGRPTQMLGSRAGLLVQGVKGRWLDLAESWLVMVPKDLRALEAIRTSCAGPRRLASTEPKDAALAVVNSGLTHWGAHASAIR